MTPSTVAESATGAPPARCAVCGGDNPKGSRFCAHCGKTLTADAPSLADTAASRVKAAVAEAAAAEAASGQPFVASADQLRAASVPLRERVVVTEPSEVPNQAKIAANPADSDAAPPVPDGQGGQIAEEIDARRARQLLDRALKLAEHGDLKSAILACRQAVALTPRAPSGYSMLGLLFERNGDVLHAIDAYQKVIELSPGSVLERESLQRLVDAASRRSGSLFHFDDNELFGDTRDARSPRATGPVSTVAPGASPRRDTTRREPGVGGSPVAATSRVPAPHPPNVVPGASYSPPAVPRVPAASAGALTAAPVPPPLPRSSVMAAPRDRGVARGALLQALQLQPSFYFRGLPIAATATLSLAVLMLARGSGGGVPVKMGQEVAPGGPVSQEPAPRPAATAATTAAGSDVRALPTAAVSSLVIASNPAQAGNSGYPVTNAVVVRPRAAPYVPARRISARAARPSITRVATNRVPLEATSSPLRPARVTGYIRPASSAAGNAFSNGLPYMPPARIVLASPNQNFAPIRTLPVDPGFTDGSSSSLGGAPVNPGKALSQGYIRISPLKGDRAGAPPRAAVLARNSEKQASADAQAGHSDSAVQHLSSAIQAGGSDTAYRYQQRAQLFFEKGDYTRAADDFQTAISGYREQIARGDRVDLAKSGLQTCQTGLQLALANKP